MLVTVCCVSTLVVIYSRDYMREHGEPERGYERFFAFLGLFVFSMCTLVLAGNFLLLYVGWELVGLCSYLLIGFYYQKPSAAAAAKKAFLVNRIGDFGFGLGVLLIYLTFDTLSYEAVFETAARAIEQNDVTVTSRLPIIALLLFCGAVGKSAQLPLYVWLPDAMEGPSPVSALIHAATMVTAGVYMVARCGVLFAADPMVMHVVAWTGGLTALFAATIALAQYDMKRILAYSTISQLGYMFLGLGVYAAPAAVFHLFTHAFFKALLFLGAGSVMHAMGGVIDVRQFSGLRRVMPATFKTFMIGGLALAGCPLLAGFFSKDEIIHHALQHNPALGVLGLVTAALTAVYTFRMIFLAFYGETRVPDGVHAHESPRWMTGPLYVLAVGAVFAGYVGFPGHAFQHYLGEPTKAFAKHATEPHGWDLSVTTMMTVSGVIFFVGLAVAFYRYVLSREQSRASEEAGLARPGVFCLLNGKYFVDEGYDLVVVQPLRWLGRALFTVDRIVIDGVVWLVAAVPQGLGFGLRGLQRGSMQGYGLGMALGAVGVLLLVLYGAVK
jgi:NADH-quinone oxidoreductase subunit L